MSSPDHLIPPPPAISLPVRGARGLFGIRRIFCVGRNYEAHAREMGAEVDREAPFYFTKSAVHAVASGATVAYPPGTQNCHHEMEWVVAIGRAAFEVTPEEALAAVFGYACGLDMTRRDLQYAARDKQRPWDLGKDFENSAVLSAIAPVSEVGHPTHGRIELEVNGVVRQSSDLSRLIHPVPALIADLSKYYHLQPGDLIFTGTPEGVGPVRPGDVLRGSIERIGDIALTIAPATAS